MAKLKFIEGQEPFKDGDDCGMTVKMAKEGRDEKGKFTAKNCWQMVRQNYNGGRPRIYNTPDELIETAMEYFEWADETQKGKYAEAHLRMHLQFYNRTSWKEYKDNPLFTNAIFIIESILEGDNEQRLMWAGSTQGAIFKLKNKHNWKDESQQKIEQHITTVNPIIESGTPPIPSE